MSKRFLRKFILVKKYINLEYMINKAFYNLICLARNKKSLDFVNKIAHIDNYSLIIPNLYLGNINCANNQQFLINNNIQSIVNCTIDEPFNEYFYNRNTFRLSITDSKETDNINKFKEQLSQDCINLKNAVTRLNIFKEHWPEIVSI